MTEQEIKTLRDRYYFDERISDEDLDKAFKGTLELAAIRLSNACESSSKAVRGFAKAISKTNKG